MTKTRILAAVIVLLLLSALPAASRTAVLDFDGQKVNVSGYIQALYSATQPDTSSFSVARLRVDIWADPNETWGYLLEIDPTTTTTLIYGWVDIKSIPWFKLRFGKFYYPFGLEYTTPPDKFDTINPSTALWNYFGYSRDIGAQVLGGVNGFKYYLSVINGQDNSSSDKNNYKDFSGRMTYDFGGLVIGASLYSGLTGSDEAVDKGRVGGEIKYVNGPFTLKGEFVSGLGEHIRSQGWYAMPIYKALPNVEGVLRYEVFDMNLDEEEDAEYLWTYGVNYYYNDSLKLQINYISNIEEGEKVNDDTFAAQLQLSY